MRGALLDINNTGTGKAPDCPVEIGFSCPPSESVAGSLHPGNMFGQAAPLISTGRGEISSVSNKFLPVC